MNTRQLEYVLTVAQTKSFSDAAKLLWISQPSLSQYIQKLEQELGVRLFERNKTPLQLTLAGKVYIESAQRILAEEKRMKNQLSDISGEQKGQIIIGAGPLNCLTILPPVIANFRALYPNVMIIVKEMTEPELIEHSETNEFDLILTTMQVNRNRFEYVHITSEDLLLVVPLSFEINKRLGGSPKGSYVEASLHDFKDEPFVVLNSNLPATIQLNELCAGEGIIINKIVECGSLAASYEMIHSGAGVGLLPSNAIRHPRTNVCCYRLKELKGTREIGVFYPKEKYVTQAMKKLVQMLSCPFEN